MEMRAKMRGHGKAQMGSRANQEQWDRFIQDPTKRLLELLADMGSQMFIYGDKRFADSLGLTIRRSTPRAMLRRSTSPADPGGARREKIAMAALETLRRPRPAGGAGFGDRLQDQRCVRRVQLLRLETLVNVVVQ
jgi:hypothetical protein